MSHQNKQKPQEVKPSNEPLSNTVARMDCADAQVTTMTGYYYVIMRDKSHHVITRKALCLEHGADCQAIRAAAWYLKNGGTKAVDVPNLIPEKCPICGGKTHHEPRLLSFTRKVAWVCETSADEERKIDTGLPERFRIYGHKHFWQAQKLERD